MKPEEKLICGIMYNFINENWDKINKKKCNITQSKVKFLNEVKTNVDTALWVFTEVCRWGMDKKYLQGLFISLSDDYNFTVINIGIKYIKLKWNIDHYDICFCKPKKKTVFYFE